MKHSRGSGNHASRDNRASRSRRAHRLVIALALFVGLLGNPSRQIGPRGRHFRSNLVRGVTSTVPPALQDPSMAFDPRPAS